MEKYVFYPTCENFFDERDEFLEKFGDKFAEPLKNNPGLPIEVYKALGLVFNKTHEKEPDPSASLMIDDDGRSFTIRSSVKGNPYGSNNGSDGISFNQVRFSLDEQNKLNVVSSFGMLVDLEEYKRRGGNKDILKGVNDNILDKMKTVLSVYHSNSVITPEGIQVGLSSYSDSCPLTVSKEDENELVNKTLTVLCPKKWDYTRLPNDVEFATHGSCTCMYRSTEDLGVVATYDGTVERDGTKDVSCNLYSSGTQWPEWITISQVPFATMEKGEYKVTPVFKELYGCSDFKEADDKVSLDFLAGVDNSETRKYKPEVYDYLRKKVVDGLKKYHGYEEPSVEENNKMSL